MMEERNKFLTIAMGYEYQENSIFGKYIPTFLTEIHLEDTLIHPFDFSTWEGFGKLWEWAIEQDWWGKFVAKYTPSSFIPMTGWGFVQLQNMINPDRFTDAVYKYLKELT